jgi:beta-N-acetylhexosaminidase
VKATLGELTPAQKAGQLVMAGVPAGDAGSGRSRVRGARLGGVFLAGRTSRSPASIRSEVRTLGGQTTDGARIGLLVATDQEGGRVQSLRGGSWSTIPRATVQGGYGPDRLTDRWRTWAAELKGAGLNMDLAPVADTVPAGRASTNPPIGAIDREYGSDVLTVQRGAAAVSQGMVRAGIIPTVKHFPGLGLVRYNTDTSTRAVDATTSVTSPYLTPFTAGIRAGAGVVMVSSATYPRIDPLQPALFSPAVITHLLRGRLGYEGVVMTDDVGQAVAVRSVPTGQRATRFIAAGGDLVLTVLPEKAPALVAAIRQKAASDKAFRAKVDISTTRVLTLKQRFGLLTCS